MDVKIEISWKNILGKEFEKPYFKDLTEFIKKEYLTYQCFPEGKDIFAAFNNCNFEQLKVVIIGQDPYHNYGQANGLCFSVNDTIKQPPSLVNIFKELNTDVGKPIPTNGNLLDWAKQGVFLLNATLTVRAHQAGSHQNKGWEQFTDTVIEQISLHKKNVVFMLWGGFAQKKGRKINNEKHLILKCGHPSPLSANRGYWFGNKHFSKTNAYLKNHNLKEIDW